MTPLTLRLEPCTYWLHARGEGGGADFDLVMERDGDGLPLLRGKHVAGLIRLALERAGQWGWFGGEWSGTAVADVLMGARAASDGGSYGDGPGCLVIHSARVSPALRQKLVARASTKASCFRRIASTAIDEQRGVAKERQLRTVEGAIPLPLEFPISFDPRDRATWAAGHQDRDRQLGRIAKAQETWVEWLRIAWPLLDEAGAKRTRGFGRLRHHDFPSTSAAGQPA